MPNQFGVPFTKGTAAVQAAGTVRCDAAVLARGSVTELNIGNISTPADDVFTVQLFRVSTAGTASGVTPNPTDEADAAATFDALDTFTVDPTIGAVLLQQPINARAGYRWVASPYQELIWPATANNGIGAGLSSGATADYAGSLMVQGF